MRSPLRQPTVAAIGTTFAGLSVALGWWILFAPAVEAAPVDVGVGITAQPIVLADPAHPGGSYQPGPVTVVNTGTETATVTLRVAAEPGADAQEVPAAWVRFDRDSIRLAGGAQASVRLRLAVPEDAAAGRYQSLLYASLASAEGPGANGVGAEAATRLTFTVGSAPGGTPRTAGPSLPVAAALAIAALGVAALLASRRRGRHNATNPPPPS